MVVGVCTVQLSLPGHRSLKEKRSAIKPLVSWLHREFNVAVAEVGDQDAWQSAVLGIAVVSTDPAHVSAMFEKIVRAIEHQRPDVFITDWGTEIL